MDIIFVFTLVALVLLGLCLGSFVNALVWRLHEGRDFVRERSECVKCHHKLEPADLVPIVSWLWLRGKCRYCKKPISMQYPLVEALTAAMFAFSYVFWPYGLAEWSGIVLLALWLVLLVGLVALLVYDARWYILPDKIVFPLMVVGLAYGLVDTFAVQQLSTIDAIARFAFAMLPIAGLYWALYTASKGKWVGFGDVKLGVLMGLVATWPQALLTVGLANLIGVLVILPGLSSGKLTRQSKVPFGPFLIAGFIISVLFGDMIIDWYLDAVVFL